MDAKHIPTTTGLNDVLQEIKEVLDKVKTAVETFTKNLLDDINLLQEKIKEIIAQIDVSTIIKDIQNKIDEILHGSGFDVIQAKKCLDQEKDALKQLSKHIQDGVTSCIKESDNVLRQLKDLALDMEEKGQKLISNTNQRILDCIHNHHIPSEAVKCVQDEFEEVKKDVDDFINELNKAISSAHDLAQKAINDLSQCASNLETTIKNEADQIIGDFENCLKNLSPPHRQTKNAIDDIIAKIKQILQQIQEAINRIENEIPRILEDLKKRIQEILEEFDEHKILDEIKKMLDKVLEGLGIDPAVAEKCTSGAEQAAEKLIKETEAGVTGCVQKADDTIRPMKDNAMLLLDKARKTIDDINNKITACTKTDLDSAFNCLMELVPEVIQDVKQMKTEIADFMVEAQKTVTQAREELEKCMFGVESNVVEGEATIVDDFKDCLKQIN